MKLTIMPESTITTDIVTTFITTLKIDDNSEIDVRISEVLSNIDNPETSNREIYTSIETYQNTIKNMQVDELNYFIKQVSDFVEENIDEIIKR